MRAVVVTLLLSAVAPYSVPAAAGISVPSVTAGRNLQKWTALNLPNPAPPNGVELTLTSDDPARLLLCKAPDQPGSPSILLKVPPGRVRSLDYCLLALADHGTATYTVSAPGMESARGTVNLSPSAIVILGPFRAPKFPTTPRANPARITLTSVVLDSAGKIVEEQPIAGGPPVEVRIANSNPNAGRLGAPTLTLAGGSSSAETYFHPNAEGETTLAPVQPPGFKMPAERGSVVAAVAMPVLAIAGDIFLGKDLQTSATLVLGEPAPPGGLKVTLTSNDSSKLLLSPKEDEPGSASIALTVPAGQSNAIYYLQSLADSGDVTYHAEAAGFRGRTAPVGLTQSGVIIGYADVGPPEEGNVLRPAAVRYRREMFVSLAESKKQPVNLVAWTAYIDRATGRTADFTIQPLRPGVTATVILTSSNPAVGTLESPLTIQSGRNRAVSQFTPLSQGTTVISVNTPRGFSTPKNATSLPATISQ